MKLAAVLVCGLVAGCYRPGAENSCTIRCSASEPCATGFACENNLCRDPSMPACDDIGPPDDAAAPDALVDATTIDASNCWGSDPLQYCSTPPPSGVRVFDIPLTINTDETSVCERSVPYPYCVITGTRITIQAPISAQGSRPLVFAATETITVTPAGEIDVSAKVVIGGAGAGPAACIASTPGTTIDLVGGGGAGGSFAGAGGPGGGGNGGVPGGNPGAPQASPTVPRGGCAGSSGGGQSSGTPGSGGGAVVLIAGLSVSVNGNVLARGSGGLGAGPSSGGGGGGSGGMIALDAPNVLVANASLIAGGGGGGGGGGSSVSAFGGNGGLATDAGEPGLGGAGGSVNVNYGGHGSGGSVQPLDGRGGSAGTTTGAGGGGGGGGAGVIRIRGVFTDQSVAIVPPRT